MTRDADRLRMLRAIRRLARALDIQSRRIDRAVGLTLPQFVVLTSVGELGEGTSRAIAAAADLSPPTVAGVLDKLEAKGLIERTRSRVDRRAVHTRLSERGREALARAPDPFGADFSAAFDALPPALRGETLAALDRVAELAGPQGAPEGEPGAVAPETSETG